MLISNTIPVTTPAEQKKSRDILKKQLSNQEDQLDVKSKEIFQ